MSSGFFDGIDKAQFEGQESRNPLAFVTTTLMR